MTTVFHLKSRWESTLKYNITILTCPWPTSYWSPWSWWTSTFDIARFTSAKYVTLIMKSLDRWKITKTLKMRTNKPVVAPKRLLQNGGEVSHRLSAHQEIGDPGCSTGRSAAPRSPPRWTPERGSHTHLHDENFQCRSGCWGGLPRIESSTKEQKGLNNIYRWNHNDDWSMTELFNFLEMFNSSPKS